MTDAPDIEYAESCNPEPVKVLGVLIPYFRVGHRLLLKQIHSPFVEGGMVGAEELATAVHILSRTYSQAKRSIHFGNSISVRLWAYKIGFMAARNPGLIKQSSEALFEYIQECQKGPKGVFVPMDTPRTHAPETLLLVRDLSNHYGYSVEEVMEMPMRRAIIERYGVLESENAVKWSMPKNVNLHVDGKQVACG